MGSQELIYVKQVQKRVLKLKIRKTEGVLPITYGLLYCYMAALWIIFLGINLHQEIDKRKIIAEQNIE